MGNSININFNFLLEFSFADIIATLGIIINTILALKIVNSIQNKLTNQRTLKDHFISEIKEIRSEYLTYIKHIHFTPIIPRDALLWFKDMNIKVADLMENLNKKYDIAVDELNAYQNDLPSIITDSNEFIHNFSINAPTQLLESTKSNIDRLNSSNQSKFTNIIVTINDHVEKN